MVTGWSYALMIATQNTIRLIQDSPLVDSCGQQREETKTSERWMNIWCSNQHVSSCKGCFTSLVLDHRPVVEVRSHFIYTVKHQFANQVEISTTEKGQNILNNISQCKILACVNMDTNNIFFIYSWHVLLRVWLTFLDSKTNRRATCGKEKQSSRPFLIFTLSQLSPESVGLSLLLFPPSFFQSV